ncbi:FAD-binding protein [Nocardioides sp. GY 10127]|uniref:FAD-binding oxidoreductase n=1 Tax=Nocardioides sp. GY 10127 TaxID=2569762 RepID=UPI0010A92AF1|nr:FAD-binding protein [Nocardioides sp. GY 10127]TIC84383.1 FAD-binding oxidoreductase [Nocardioides sp. GY 10127]
MTSTPLSSRPGVAALRAVAPGRVHLPGEPGYEAERLPWNLAFDQRPAAVAVPETPGQVAALVRAAHAAGLRVAPQNTGHGAGPLTGRLDDALLLRLAALTGVTVDAEARTARVLGGTQWQDVLEAAAPHGLTAPHGTAPDVGVVGYLLSGGLSFYGRRHGLGINTVRAVEVVMPTGELLRADAEENPDLFWALRGGSGNLGVVTALEIDLLPYTDVVSGMLLWDGTQAEPVTRAWLDWTRGLDEAATTSLRIMEFPPLPDLPPFLSGRRVVVIDGLLTCGDAEAEALLAPLRALGAEMDTFHRMPTTEATAVHMDPPHPAPGLTAHTVLGPLDEAGATAFLAATVDIAPLMAVELRHVGGAIARPAPHGGALSAMPGELVAHCIALVPTREIGAAAEAVAERVLAALRRWEVEACALTFTDDIEPDAARVGTAFSPGTWQRLRTIRSVYDPTSAMVAALSID